MDDHKCKAHADIVGKNECGVYLFINLTGPYLSDIIDYLMEAC